MTDDALVNLPSDIAECHDVIRKLARENNQLALKNQELTHQLQLATKKKYGKKAEELTIEQLRLVFDELKEEYPDLDLVKFEEETIEKYNVVNGGGGRRITQDNPAVETKEITYEIEAAELVCPECQGQRTECGSETTEELDYIPGKFVKKRHKRLKYACKTCKNKVIIAPKPEVLVIEKGAPSSSLLANIITNKYADHLPLYRQEQIFERMGILISRSSMCRWLSVVANKFELIYNLIVSEILNSKVIQADETPLKCLKESKGKAKQGYVWTFVGDYQHNYVAYSFHLDRSGVHPDEFLKGYTGYLQTDAYTGYNKIHQREGIKPLACMAHVRRKFDESINNNKIQSNYALLEISKLYEIEKRIKNLDDDEKFKIRQAEAIPILNNFKEWLLKMKLRYAPNEPFSKAVSYTLNHFDKLTVYTQTGYLSIDNNMAERNIRPIAIGRKNWLFLGNAGAGKTFSILSTIVNCCKMNNINVYEYLKSVLDKITIEPNCDSEKLLPLNWQRN